MQAVLFSPRALPLNTAKMKVQNMTFKEGQEFKIRVKPKDDCASFAVNIGHDSDNIALHFNPRFDSGGVTNTIVCNSMSGGCWGEEHRDEHFPFACGEESKFYINFNNEQFYIKLPDGTMMNFPNRLGDVKYRHFEVTGGAKVIGIKIK
ncbi:galectin-2-like [Lampris incognitus]|uniref:galectin-2-like n=1 Tax=Lampris incognitus TaxID=2546036 RepID=UPI0024B5A433|nr:galectin-2-like [Lampris incognitus]